MASNKDHIDNIFGEDQVLSQEVMQKYLEGKLSPQEMHEVEKIMVDDDFYDDVMEGMELMKDSTVATSHINEINSKIPEILGQKKGKRVLFPMLGGMAASIALIIGLVYFFNSTPDNNDTSSEQALTAPVEDSKEEKEPAEQPVEESANESDAANKPKPLLLEEKSNAKEFETSDNYRSQYKSAPGLGNGLISDRESEKISEENDDDITYFSDGVDEMGDISPTALPEVTVEEEEEALTEYVINKDKAEGADMADLKFKGNITPTIGSEMIAMNDPAMPASISSNGVTAMSAFEKKADKSRKEKVSKPRFREGSFQAKTTDKKEHNKKKKENDLVMERADVDLGSDADIKFSTGEYAKAASLYELVLQQKPTETHSLYMSGVAYLKTNNNKLAIERLSKVTNDKNIGDDALWYLAIAYSNQGNNLKAKETLQKLIDKKSKAHFDNAQKVIKKL